MFIDLSEKWISGLTKVLYCVNEAVFGIGLSFLVSELSHGKDANVMMIMLSLGMIIFSVLWHRPLRKQKEGYDVIHNKNGEIIREGAPLREKLIVALADIGMGIQAASLMKITLTDVNIDGDFMKLLIAFLELSVFAYVGLPYMMSQSWKRAVYGTTGYSMSSTVAIITFIFRDAVPLFNPLNYVPFIPIGFLGAWVAVAARYGGRKKLNIVILAVSAANIFFQLFVNFSGDVHSVYRLAAAIVLTADQLLHLVATLTKTQPKLKADIFDSDDFDDSGE